MRKVIPMLAILTFLCAGFYAGICVLAPSVLANPSVPEGGLAGIERGAAEGAAEGNAAAGPLGAILGSVVGGAVGGVNGVLGIEEHRSAYRYHHRHGIDGHTAYP